MRKHNRSMLEGPLLSGLISYTIPIMLTGVLQLLFNAADMVIIGQFRGSNAVAAVGATGSLTTLILNLMIGLSVGTGVAVAHGIGGKQDLAVHKTVHSALLLSLVGGAVVTVIGVCFSGKFLEWMGTDSQILPLSKTYMQIYFGGITFTMIYNFCSSMLRAAGDTKSPLIFLTIAGVINVLLNIIFVTVFSMNVDGVALATIISQGVSAALVMIALMRRTDACKLELKKLRFYGRQMKKIVSIGLPAGIQGSLFSISNVMIQSSINSFGATVMAGHAAAGNLDAFVYTIQNSFMQTTVNYVGQNAGAHNFDRIKKVVRTCALLVIGFGLLSGGLVYLFGETLLGIYLPADPQAIQYGMTRLLFICTPYFLCGLMEVSTGAMRGIGSSITPMIMSVVGVCGFRIVWILTVFASVHTLECLYSSYLVTWIITDIAQYAGFIYIYKKKKKKYQAALHT